MIYECPIRLLDVCQKIYKNLFLSDKNFALPSCLLELEFLFHFLAELSSKYDTHRAKLTRPSSVISYGSAIKHAYVNGHVKF